MFEARKLFSTALATVGLCVAASAVGLAFFSRAEPILFESRAVAVSISTIGKQGTRAYGAELSPDALRASLGIPPGRTE